jgi:hypothetical protein
VLLPAHVVRAHHRPRAAHEAVRVAAVERAFLMFFLRKNMELESKSM